MAESGHVDDLAFELISKLKIRGASSSSSSSNHGALPQDKWAYKEQVKTEIGAQKEQFEDVEGDLKNIRQWRGFQPSKIDLVGDKIRGFVVNNPRYKKTREKIASDLFVELGKEFLETPKNKVNETTIRNLAKKYDVKRGKWMLFVQWPEKAEIAWQNLITRLAEGTIKGQENIVQITIDVFDPRETNPHKTKDEKSQRIKIVTDDYTDEDETKRVGSAVLDVIGVDVLGGAIKYKADIYSKLKIMAANPYKLRPSIYYLKAATK